MINKIKFAVPALALGLLLSSTAVFAQGYTTTGANTDTNGGTTTTVVTKKTKYAQRRPNPLPGHELKYFCRYFPFSA